MLTLSRAIACASAPVALLVLSQAVQAGAVLLTQNRAATATAEVRFEGGEDALDTDADDGAGAFAAEVEAVAVGGFDSRARSTGSLQSDLLPGRFLFEGDSATSFSFGPHPGDRGILINALVASEVRADVTFRLDGPHRVTATATFSGDVGTDRNEVDGGATQDFVRLLELSVSRDGAEPLNLLDAGPAVLPTGTYGFRYLDAYATVFRDFPAPGGPGGTAERTHAYDVAVRFEPAGATPIPLPPAAWAGAAGLAVAAGAGWKARRRVVG